MTRKKLDNTKEKGKSMSELVEKCVKNMAEQFDPGRACKTVAKILPTVENDLDKARAEGDFDLVQALAGLRKALEPFAGACELTKPEKKDPTP
jgi:hypothetical protein